MRRSWNIPRPRPKVKIETPKLERDEISCNMRSLDSSASPSVRNSMALSEMTNSCVVSQYSRELIGNWHHAWLKPGKGTPTVPYMSPTKVQYRNIFEHLKWAWYLCENLSMWSKSWPPFSSGGISGRFALKAGPRTTELELLSKSAYSDVEFFLVTYHALEGVM